MIRLTEQDLSSIRKALKAWGKPSLAIERYSERLFLSQAEIWHKFVTMDWTRENREKYEQDLTIRYWLQVAIEAVSEDCANRLANHIRESDEVFVERSVPQQCREYGKRPTLRQEEYFWEIRSLITPE